jgi:hypothetical protein
VYNKHNVACKKLDRDREETARDVFFSSEHVERTPTYYYSLALIVFLRDRCSSYVTPRKRIRFTNPESVTETACGNFEKKSELQNLTCTE